MQAVSACAPKSIFPEPTPKILTHLEREIRYLVDGAILEASEEVIPPGVPPYPPAALFLLLLTEQLTITSMLLRIPSVAQAIHALTTIREARQRIVLWVRRRQMAPVIFFNFVFSTTRVRHSARCRFLMTFAVLPQAQQVNRCRAIFYSPA